MVEVNSIDKQFTAAVALHLVASDCGSWPLDVSREIFTRPDVRRLSDGWRSYAAAAADGSDKRGRHTAMNLLTSTRKVM